MSVGTEWYGIGCCCYRCCCWMVCDADYYHFGGVEDGSVECRLWEFYDVYVARVVYVVCVVYVCDAVHVVWCTHPSVKTHH